MINFDFQAISRIFLLIFVTEEFLSSNTLHKYEFLIKNIKINTFFNEEPRKIFCENLNEKCYL